MRVRFLLLAALVVGLLGAVPLAVLGAPGGGVRVERAAAFHCYWNGRRWVCWPR